MEIRYYKKERLGIGAFGEVWQAVNVDSGTILALKMIKWPESGVQSHQYTMMKREVETWARMSHPNIVEFIFAQGHGKSHLEIFTTLQEGNIEGLIKKELFVGDANLATSLLRDMLRALDYLAFKGIVHRDVNPANILYTSVDRYTFRLADFGLCNVTADSRSSAGSPIYMAPEMFSETSQTPKGYVYSLFITMAYPLNVDGFREKQLHSSALRIKAALEAANEVGFRPLKDMAIVDPNVRASAADMLDKLFNGRGRSTQRNQEQRVPGANKIAAPPRKDDQEKTTKTTPPKRHSQGTEAFDTTEK